MGCMRGELVYLETERVRSEFLKVLSDELSTPSRFFDTLKLANVLDVYFPEVLALDVPDKHDGTSYIHTMRCIDNIGKLEPRFALLCHDFGKGVTPPENHPCHYNHDHLGVPLVEAFCDRLSIPTRLRKLAIMTCSEHMRVKKIPQMSPGKLIKLIEEMKEGAYFTIYMAFIDHLSCDTSTFDEALHDYREMKKYVNMAYAVVRSITGGVLIAEGVAVKGKHFGDLLHQRRVEELRRRMNASS